MDVPMAAPGYRHLTRKFLFQAKSCRYATSREKLAWGTERMAAPILSAENWPRHYTRLLCLRTPPSPHRLATKKSAQQIHQPRWLDVAQLLRRFWRTRYGTAFFWIRRPTGQQLTITLDVSFWQSSKAEQQQNNADYSHGRYFCLFLKASVRKTVVLTFKAISRTCHAIQTRFLQY